MGQGFRTVKAESWREGTRVHGPRSTVLRGVQNSTFITAARAQLSGWEIGTTGCSPPLPRKLHRHTSKWSFTHSIGPWTHQDNTASCCSSRSGVRYFRRLPRGKAAMAGCGTSLRPRLSPCSIRPSTRSLGFKPTALQMSSGDKAVQASSPWRSPHVSRGLLSCFSGGTPPKTGRRGRPRYTLSTTRRRFSQNSGQP